MPRILLLSCARSGSTYLLELLRSHPECHLEGELLNSDMVIKGDPLDYLEKSLASHPETFVGFKVFPSQFKERRLQFDEVVRHLGVTSIIILYRESVLETLTSLKIAEQTKVWYSTERVTEENREQAMVRVTLEPENVQHVFEDKKAEWEEVARQWPGNVQQIFVRYEDLGENPKKELHRIFAQLGCPVAKDFSFCSAAQRQNPAPVAEKVTNWHQLPPEIRNLQLNVAEIFSKVGFFNLTSPSSMQVVSKELQEIIPDREPLMPAEGWRYRVADPFMPTQLKQNVMDAVFSGSVSSAGFWPRRMATKLKALFGVPVAQPCNNGFSSLLLAIQAIGVEPGDEVIMPSLTMIAVANAAAFLGATPIFVDSAPDNYNPTWDIIENSMSNKTKIVILTHTYGLPTPDLEKIASECKKRGIWLIEDISQCVGVKAEVKGQRINGCVEKADEKEKIKSKLLGTFGDFACASMYANKMVHAGDGGFVLAKDPKFGPRLTSLVNHGFTPSYHFLHFEVCANAKINGLGAAMACGCLDNLDKVMAHRSQLAGIYRKLLLPVTTTTQVKLMPSCGFGDTPWVFGIECSSRKERTELRGHLARHGIETRDYFFPLHLQPAFAKTNNNNNIDKMLGKLPNCEKLGSIGFYLPTHSNLTPQDLTFIASVVTSFFATESKVEPQPPRMNVKTAVQIQPDSFGVEVRAFDAAGSGQLTQFKERGHVSIQAVKLGLEAEEILIRERWDDKELFLTRVSDCIKMAKDEGVETKDVEEFFQPYVTYIRSQGTVEQPVAKPWLQIDLNDQIFSDAQKIPTTSDPETLQLLVWLIQETRPKIIWEIGTWFGHATALMAASLKSKSNIKGDDEGGPKIFACDAFQWQNWMDIFLDPDMLRRMNYTELDSFLTAFQEYTNTFKDIIHPVKWPYEIDQLPEILKLRDYRPDLIYLDITQESDDLDKLWSLLQPSLIPDKTVILFNGLAHSSMRFFSEHSETLVPIAKPNTIAKAFRYSGPRSKLQNAQESENSGENEPVIPRLEKRVRFPPELIPRWDHHHQNLFGEAMHLVQQEFHDESAPILFIPAVEEAICDYPELLMDNEWIGIIHSVVRHPEFFYIPDLTKISSPECNKVMRKCRGLFTMTKFQTNFLLENWPKSLSKIPIQPITYPIVQNPDKSSEFFSKVPEMWETLSKNGAGKGHSIDLVLIGSFARDFDLFFREPVPNHLRKVLLAVDESAENAYKEAPKSVFLMNRQDPAEYEKLLEKSIVFLSLKYDGAANTLVLECISRNVPIVAPALNSVMEYLGPNYPLLYDPGQPNLNTLITLENVEKAIDHLQKMDKVKFDPIHFLRSIRESAVISSLPPSGPVNTSLDPFDFSSKLIPQRFDVTISICSYKRTHHLKSILESLWDNQNFSGSFQIIVWNNNDSRAAVVREICRPFLEKPTKKKSLELINSTANYYCAIRFALAPLMKSNALLICDDDILPTSNFVSFFMSSHRKHPNDVLCLRGHSFRPHKLSLENPRDVWDDYENLKFHDDHDPEQLIHFVHADACLIPRSAIEQMASARIPENSAFHLVDDYWMSFVLNHKFGRKLRKLSSSGSLHKNEGPCAPPFTRAFDSDQVGLALHTRPEVFDARVRLYIHHMLAGWPTWNAEEKAGSENFDIEMDEAQSKKLRAQKWAIWDTFFIGYNISSRLDQKGVQALSRLGVRCVRIGAVGVGRRIEYEFEPFSGSDEEAQGLLEKLKNLVDSLADQKISVVLTLDRRLASPAVWTKIAEAFRGHPSVVGYDLINEPFTPRENEISWSEVATTEDEEGSLKIMNRYLELIHSIRKVDKVTPIIIEPSFWGHLDALDKLKMDELLSSASEHDSTADSNCGLIVSFHFYEPAMLTQTQAQNKGHFKFPGNIPIFENTEHSPMIYWDAAEIRRRFIMARDWSKATSELSKVDDNENSKIEKVKIFCGEFGIRRQVGGAGDYLKSVIEACRESEISGFLFSFRDDDWSDMDYEFGPDPFNFSRTNLDFLDKDKDSSVEGNEQDEDCNTASLMHIVARGIRGEAFN